ncbi:Outer membrane protein A [Paraburkholderia aspalathi]|nr:Outer membrane protein A [Paraburkholderia aspalathi]
MALPTLPEMWVNLRTDVGRAYRVECHGIFESTNSCVKVAQRICGDQPVRMLNKTEHLQTPGQSLDDPRVLTFQCAAAPQPVTASPVSVTPAPVPVTAAPPMPEEISLSADALFAFGRGDLGALKPDGRQQLENIAAKLQTVDVAKRMVVSGYTDRLGNTTTNLRQSHSAGQGRDSR